MKKEEVKEVHVLPYLDGTKYKNGKDKIKWVVRTNVDLEKEAELTKSS
jgi:hypothetical protein